MSGINGDCAPFQSRDRREIAVELTPITCRLLLIHIDRGRLHRHGLFHRLRRLHLSPTVG